MLQCKENSEENIQFAITDFALLLELINNLLNQSKSWD